jgi:hypothetical protein
VKIGLSGNARGLAMAEGQVLLQMVFQGAVLVARAGIERERLAQSIDVLIDSPRQRRAPAA